jgi:hypothetical protein
MKDSRPRRGGPAGMAGLMESIKNPVGLMARYCQLNALFFVHCPLVVAHCRKAVQQVVGQSNFLSLS